MIFDSSNKNIKAKIPVLTLSTYHHIWLSVIEFAHDGVAIVSCCVFICVIKLKFISRYIVAIMFMCYNLLYSQNYKNQKV
jgi:hypothetical protein